MAFQPLTLSDPPVRPWFEGTRDIGTAIITMGRDHVRAAALRLAEREEFLASDIETEGLKLPASDKVHCVGVGTAEEVVIFDPRDHYQAMALREVFAAARMIVFHNSPYDLPVLYRVGLWDPDHIPKLRDTVIWARGARPQAQGKNGLEALAVELLGRPAGDAYLKRAAKMEKIKIDDLYRRFDLDRPLYVEGLAADVTSTAALVPKLRQLYWEKITTNPWEGWRVDGDEAVRLLDREQVVNHAMVRRSCLGVAVDLEFADNFADRNEGPLNEAARILRGVGVEPENPASMVEYLDKEGAIPPRHPRLKNGKPSGAKDYLDRLNHPIAKLFIGHKEQVKLQRDYLTKMVEFSVNGRIHPITNVFGASASGRMSAGSPPVQQFPQASRNMILFDEGGGTTIDWSQIEPTGAAYLARDRVLLDPYENERMKVYDIVARLTGLAKAPCKVVVLAGMYGQGIPLLTAGLSNAFGREVSEDFARDIRGQVNAAMPGTQGFFQSVKNAANRDPRISTVSGRVLDVPRQRDDETGRWRTATHKAVNFVVQGSAYDLLAESIWVLETLGLGSAIYFAMHDELVVNSLVAELVRQVMTTPPASFVRRAGTVPVLRTDMDHMGAYWMSEEQITRRNLALAG